MRRVGQIRRRDSAERPIVDALRQLGALVFPVSAPGAPDLFVRYRGRWSAFEVKTGKGTLTKAQHLAGAEREWPVIRTVQDAIDHLMDRAYPTGNVPWEETKTFLAASPSPPVTQEPALQKALDDVRLFYHGLDHFNKEPFRDALNRLQAIVAAPLAPPETCEWREDDDGALTAGCNTSRTPVRFSWAVAKGFAACPYCLRPLSLSSGGTPLEPK